GRGASEAYPTVLEPPRDYLARRSPNKDWNRQDRSPLRSLAGDDMRGNYHKVAGDVSGKQPAQTKKADHIHLPAVRLSTTGSSRMPNHEFAERIARSVIVWFLRRSDKKRTRQATCTKLPPRSR